MARVVRVPVPALVTGLRDLLGEEAHYVTRVHRMGAGDEFVAFDPEAAVECTVAIQRCSVGRVTCEFGVVRPASRRGELPVTLLQAPGKTERLEEVVRAATALGVRGVHVLRSERSVFIPSEKHRERLRSIAVDGARQSGRGDLPRIEGPSTLLDALASVSASVRLCLHPRSPTSLAERLGAASLDAEVALLVGPEGGFSDAELAAIARLGFELAALGPLTLRAELAAIAALGALAARLPGSPDAL